MAVTKAQMRAVRKYTKAHYECSEVRFPKGYRSVVKEHAASRGESLNGFIMRALAETMERDKEAAGN